MLQYLNNYVYTYLSFYAKKNHILKLKKIESYCSMFSPS